MNGAASGLWGWGCVSLGAVQRPHGSVTGGVEPLQTGISARDPLEHHSAYPSLDRPKVYGGSLHGLPVGPTPGLSPSPVAMSDAVECHVVRDLGDGCEAFGDREHYPFLAKGI